jgi:hypothetical protein
MSNTITLVIISYADPSKSQPTAKNQYRKFETNIPRKGIARPQSQFPHSSVCERFIYCITNTIGLPIPLEKICELILGIQKSLTDA